MASDTERLDWLDEHCVAISKYKGDLQFYCPMKKPKYKREKIARQAIDKAMESEK